MRTDCAPEALAATLLLGQLPRLGVAETNRLQKYLAQIVCNRNTREREANLEPALFFLSRGLTFLETFLRVELPI